MKEQKDEKQKLGFQGYVLLCWFAISFFYLFLANDHRVFGMIFGQFFFIFGIITFFGLINDEDGSWLFSLPFMIIGYVVFLNSFYNFYPNISRISIVEIIYVFPFVTLGFLILFGQIIRMIYLRIVCTHKVRATVISKIKKDKHSYILCPNYEYNYGHKRYKTKYNELYNLNITHVGKTTNIYINPNNPNQTLVINLKSIFLGLILGVVFVYPLIEPIKNLLF